MPLAPRRQRALTFVFGVSQVSQVTHVVHANRRANGAAVAVAVFERQLMAREPQPKERKAPDAPEP